MVKGRGGSKSLSLQPLIPPALLKNVWGKGAGGRMGRGTYHIQGLPMGEGAKKERKQDLGSEAWAPHLASLPTPVAHHPEQSNERKAK